MSTYVSKRNLIIFILVALSIGWIGVWVDQLVGPQEEEETIGMAIWLIVPLLLVINLRTFFGDGWKDAGLRPGMLKNWRWYLVAFLIFPVVTGISLVLGSAFGWIDFKAFDTPVYFRIFAGLLGVNILKNIFEESVWRGYLTVKLVKLNLSDIWIYVIAGLVWGLWHAPYYLVFLPEEMLYTVLPTGRVIFLMVALINMLVWTVMFTELYRLTKSIWPVILLHAVEDALINHLVIDGHILIAGGLEIFISPICGIIPTLLYLGIGLWLRSVRRNTKNTI